MQNIFTKSFKIILFIEDAINQIVKLSFSNKTNNQIYNIGNMREEIKITI